jgi:outer membrane protein insertion porin family
MANPFLGGSARYEWMECAYAFHHPLGGGITFHGNGTHGIVHSRDPDRRLPFNRRFFPGGSHSIRGFGEGQAAPRGNRGKSMGATSYYLISGELDQRLLNRLALFLFCDGLGCCEDIHRYPADTFLLSAGSGISLHTFLGPLRLTYAHNFHRRPGDRSFRLSFSCGSPF